MAVFEIVFQPCSVSPGIRAMTSLVKRFEAVDEATALPASMIQGSGRSLL